MSEARYQRFDNGELVDETDDRTVKEVRAARLVLIRARAAAEIYALDMGWMVEREATGGDPVPADVKAKAAAIRTKSNGLEEKIDAVTGTGKAACDKIEKIAWK